MGTSDIYSHYSMQSNGPFVSVLTLSFVFFSTTRASTIRKTILINTKKMSSKRFTGKRLKYTLYTQSNRLFGK